MRSFIPILILCLTGFLPAQAGKVSEFSAPNRQLSVRYHDHKDPGEHQWFELVNTATGRPLFTDPGDEQPNAHDVFVLWAKENSAVAVSINLMRVGSTRVFRITDGIAKECVMPKLEIPKTISPNAADVNHYNCDRHRCKEWLDQDTLVIQVEMESHMRKGTILTYGCNFTVRFDQHGKGTVIKTAANPSSEHPIEG
jgi:hypothetical protein